MAQYCLPDYSRAYSRRATDPRRATCDNQCYAAAYFDNFKYKATQDQKLDLNILINTPITFEKFYTTLMHKAGTKSPGPTGLTISVLQSTPTVSAQKMYTRRFS